MSERDLLNAPKTHGLLNALHAARVDVHPGSGLYTVLMDLAHVEATKTSELVTEFQRSNSVTIKVETSEEAQRLTALVRSFEGAASEIDKRVSEKDATIKALADALVNLRCISVSQGVSEQHGVITNTDAALRLAGRLP